MDAVEAVKKRVEGCRDCHLSTTCSPVPLHGSATANYLFVLDEPSGSEVLLRGVVRKAGLFTREVAYTHLVRCSGARKRKGQGKGKMQEQYIEACRSNMMLELAAIKPRIIVACGAVVLKWFRPDLLITKHHGIPFMWTGMGRATIVIGAPDIEGATKSEELHRQLVVDIDRAVKLIKKGTTKGWHWGCVMCQEEGEYADESGLMYCHRHRQFVGVSLTQAGQLMMV